MDDFTTSGYKEFGNGTSDIEMVVPRGIEVLEFREVPAYGFGSFVADFGGYLGLLLGGSILSIFDDIMDFIKSVNLGGILPKKDSVRSP